VKTPLLREWREAQGETQSTLSALSGLTVATISRVENGYPLRPGTAKKLAEALGVSVVDLMNNPPVPAGKADAPATGPAAPVPPRQDTADAVPGAVDKLLEEVAFGFSGAHEFEKHVARMANSVHSLLLGEEPVLDEPGDAQEYTKLFGPELAERYQAYVDALRATTHEFDKDLRTLLLRTHAREAAAKRAPSEAERTTNG
jgi:transcriptional regulator with XRE-family HTH domain